MTIEKEIVTELVKIIKSEGMFIGTKSEYKMERKAHVIKLFPQIDRLESNFLGNVNKKIVQRYGIGSYCAVIAKSNQLVLEFIIL